MQCLCLTLSCTDDRHVLERLRVRPHHQPYRRPVRREGEEWHVHQNLALAQTTLHHRSCFWAYCIPTSVVMQQSICLGKFTTGWTKKKLRLLQTKTKRHCRSIWDCHGYQMWWFRQYSCQALVCETVRVHCCLIRLQQHSCCCLARFSCLL